MEGYVYLIQQDCYYKIGFSKNLFNRTKQYNTHNANYSLLYYIKGGRDLEKELHRRFKKYNYSLEWFYVNSDILSYFQRMDKKYYQNPIL